MLLKALKGKKQHILSAFVTANTMAMAILKTFEE